MSEPIRVEKIDVNKLELQFPSEIQTKNTTGFYVRVSYDKRRLRMKLPPVMAPYGAGTQQASPNKYSIGITFEGMEEKENDRARKAYNALVAINERFRELMMEHKESFFKDAVQDSKDGKKTKSKGSTSVPDEVFNQLIANRYKSFLRERDDNGDIMYLNITRRKLKKKEEDNYTPEEKEEIAKRFETMGDYPLIIDEDGNAIDVTIDNIRDVIPWGTKVKPVIDFLYFWVTPEKVHPIWSMVYGWRMSTGVTRKFNIMKDSDDEEDDEIDRMYEDQDENKNDADGEGSGEDDDVEEEEEMAMAK